MAEGTSVLDYVKYVISTCALIFSIVLIMGLIFTDQTTLARDVHPGLAVCTLWISVLWLTMVEGSQGSLVGLAPVDRELFKDSHPITYKCCEVAHKGDNLDRYLLGRQFMVVVMVFTINISGGPIADATIWGFPDLMTNIFLGSGLAMILFTCMVGQLNSQVTASLCMLDYINNYFAVFTLWVSNAIEFSGLLHSSYLIQMLVAALAGQKIESNEAPRTGVQNFFFYLRCLGSLAILGFSFAVTLAGLFEGKTTMWEGVPEWAAVIVFFILMSVIGLLEGMQIAFFAVAKIPASERGDSVFAKKTCELLFKGEGRNLPGFDAWQKFFNTGLLGAIITTIVASIAWQLVASAFPIAFLSNPFTYIFLRICLFLEATGLCSGAWVLAEINKTVAGYQRDEVYIGTAEERAAKHHADDAEQLHMGPGHPRKLPGFTENVPPALQRLMKSDASVKAFLNSMQAMENGDQTSGQSAPKEKDETEVASSGSD
jgi:hypothetical protein